MMPIIIGKSSNLFGNPVDGLVRFGRSCIQKIDVTIIFTARQEWVLAELAQLAESGFLGVLEATKIFAEEPSALIPALQSLFWDPTENPVPFIRLP